MRDIKNLFKSRGYYIFQLSDVDQIFAYRKEIENIRIKNPTTSIFNIDKVLESNLWRLQFDRNILNVCGEIFGSFGFINDFNLQCERIDVGDKLNGWHPDCGSEGNSSYLRDSEYKFAKIGIYFQKNSKGIGGGIDVIPFSHHLYMLPSFIRNIIYRFLIKFSKIFGKTVETGAGSVVIFDSRLLHRSTELLNYDGRREEKFVLYWEVASNNCHEEFLLNAVKRAYLTKLQDGDPNFFRSYLPYCYPEDYNSEYVVVAKRENITIHSFNKYICEGFKKIGLSGHLWN